MNKKIIKQFLRPDWEKVGLTVFFFLASFFLIRILTSSTLTSHGLIINIFFWYFISCVIILFKTSLKTIFKKLDWRKILLAVIFMVLSFLFGIASFIQQGYFVPHDLPFITPFYGEFSTICGTTQDSIYCRLRGFPFPYFQMEECSEGPQLPAFHVGYKWLLTELIVDLIFWYFISCVIIFAYDKFRTKK